MAGHNKWTQIKRKKGATDAQKSKIFSKLGRLISLESRKAGGKIDSPGLRTVMEKARFYNMPKDTIERAVKKGVGGEDGELEAITYEAYAPGGVALMIEALTGNRNKAANEIKYILAEHRSSLGTIGSASWAFKKMEGDWIPNAVVEADEQTRKEVEALIEALEENDEVQDVYTNLSESL